MIACGLLAGMAGTFFSLGQLYTFIEGVTGGRGFIVLAVYIGLAGRSRMPRALGMAHVRD